MVVGLFLSCKLSTKHLIWVFIQYTNYTGPSRYICSSFLTTVYRHCWLVDTTKGAWIDTIYTSINFSYSSPLWGLLPTYLSCCVSLLVSLVELVTTIVLFLYLINRVVYTTITSCTHPFYKINRIKKKKGLVFFQGSI